LSLALEGLGAQVRTADSVEDSVPILQRATHPPDVILADIGLPGTDGYAIPGELRKLDARLSSVPVIALTAYAGEQNESRALSAGFRRHCAKPVDPDTVARLILDVVRKGDSHLFRN